MLSNWRFRAVVTALFVALPASVMAQVTIQSITSSQQSGTDVVRIELSEALPGVPAGFTVQAPPRIAIDLPGVVNGLGKSSIDVNQGNLRSVRVAQSGERTRLVLNLKKSATYRAEVQGKVLLLVLDAVDGHIGLRVELLGRRQRLNVGFDFALLLVHPLGKLALFTAAAGHPDQHRADGCEHSGSASDRDHFFAPALAFAAFFFISSISLTSR